ncbi:MAG: OmpA family protein [Bacteroidetes bacterium]|nr:OmpA family protein [Bacteroidota bacterium]
MKKIIVFTLVLLAATYQGHSQFKNLVNKVKNKVDQRVNKKEDDVIDKTLDKAEGKDDSKETASSKTTTNNQPVEEPGLRSFSKYDFIPGDSLLYYDNFDGEALAELPTAWNTSGTGEVVTLDKYPGQWLRLHKPFIYLGSNQKQWVENYTVEFDVILQLKNNGWMYPYFRFGLFSTKDESNTDNSFLKEYKKYACITASLYPGEFKSTKANVESFLENNTYFKGDNKSFEALEKLYGMPVHIAVQVQKERFRMWVNEEKLFDIPKAIPGGSIMDQLMFEVGNTNYAENQYAVYIGNIKVATGKPDTRHKLIEEGKFSTTGILFDVNAATIKPESAGVLKEIAALLSQYKDVHIKIVGHTDSDGTDAANLALSQKRAAAVKEALVNDYGINADRMETDGKGETEPVSDNKTKEGKAANRRVELIKM